MKFIAPALILCGNFNREILKFTFVTGYYFIIAILIRAACYDAAVRCSTPGE